MPVYPSTTNTLSAFAIVLAAGIAVGITLVLSYQSKCELKKKLAEQSSAS